MMQTFLKKLKIIFTDKALLKRIAFIFGILIIFRLLSAIPVPGVNASELAKFLTNNEFFGFLNLSNVEKQDDGGRGGGKKSRKPSSIEPDEPPPDGCVYTRGDVVKNRYGGSGEVIFLFDKRHGMFRDYVKQRDGSIPESAYDDAPFDPGE
jgi:hypothetical protein